MVGALNSKNVEESVVEAAEEIYYVVAKDSYMAVGGKVEDGLGPEESPLEKKWEK